MRGCFFLILLLLWLVAECQGKHSRDGQRRLVKAEEAFPIEVVPKPFSPIASTIGTIPTASSAKASEWPPHGVSRRWDVMECSPLCETGEYPGHPTTPWQPDGEINIR